MRSEEERSLGADSSSPWSEDRLGEWRGTIKMEMIVQRLKSRIVGTRGDPGAWTLKILGQKVRETLGGQSRGKTRTKREKNNGQGPDGDGNSRTVGLVNFRRGPRRSTTTLSAHAVTGDNNIPDVSTFAGNLNIICERMQRQFCLEGKRRRRASRHPQPPLLGHRDVDAPKLPFAIWLTGKNSGL